jgi:hypothetical protein
MDNQAQCLIAKSRRIRRWQGLASAPRSAPTFRSRTPCRILHDTAAGDCHRQDRGRRACKTDPPALKTTHNFPQNGFPAAMGSQALVCPAHAEDAMLIKAFGEAYESYCRSTGALIPWPLSRTRKAESATWPQCHKKAALKIDPRCHELPQTSIVSQDTCAYSYESVAALY